MTVQTVTDMEAPIGEILRGAGSEGILLRGEGGSSYALIPLDEDLLDFLIERNPKFIDECRKIGERMQNGKLRTQLEINELFGRKIP